MHTFSTKILMYILCSQTNNNSKGTNRLIYFLQERAELDYTSDKSWFLYFDFSISFATIELLHDFWNFCELKKPKSRK